jgi:hypothetical protein
VTRHRHTITNPIFLSNKWGPPQITGTADNPVYSDGTAVDTIPLTTTFLDPIVSTGSSQTAFYAFFGNNKWSVAWLKDSEGNYYPADSSPAYLSETNGFGSWQAYLGTPITLNPELSLSPSDFSLVFEDNPSFPKGISGYMKFQLELVGVKSDGTLVLWSGLGTNIVWKSDGVNAQLTISFLS